jgi:uncharacterized protein (DUF2336 family)
MLTNDRSVIDTLEAALGSADPEKRVAVLDHVTDLFVAGASRYTEAQVTLFDQVFIKLAAEIETEARRKLASRLASLEHPPKRIASTLARDPSSAVASPILRHVLELENSDIIAVSTTGSEAHLDAIAGRRELPEEVSDILVERGGPAVVRTLAGNPGAHISDATFGKLVTRAGSDPALAETVGRRRDIPRQRFVELLRGASASVRVKLAAADPALAREIEAAIGEVIGEIGRDAKIVSSDPEVARSEIERIAHPERSGDVDTGVAARARKFDQTARALSLLCRVPPEVAERALAEDKPDMLMIIAKVANCPWKTIKSLLQIQHGEHPLPIDDLLRLRGEYERLQVDSARRVLDHYRERRRDQDAPSAA